MGAWDYRIFCDDTSLDALDEIVECDDLFTMLASFIGAAADRADDYIDYDTAEYALAACAILDGLLNGLSWELLTESPDGIESYESFFAENRVCASELEPLRPKAVQAIDCILSSSEVQELWAENEDLYPLWHGNLLNLKERLSK